MRCYVDSSVVLRYILTDSTEFERVREFAAVGASELLEIECRRVIQRFRLDGDLTDDQLRDALAYFAELYSGLTVIEMNAAVKRRAAGAMGMALA